MSENYPRDLIGYGRNPPQANWPGGARVALQFVLNYEEGAENTILDGDPAATLVLIEGKHKEWRELLMARLRGGIGKAAGRIRFVPRQGFDDFLSLLRCADVILDPPVFGGGNSTLEALAMGTPVVTLPGDFLRARISTAWYRKMDLMDCVAKDGEDYVRIALEMGRDPVRRAEVAGRISERADILFDDTGAVRGLEEFLIEAVKR